MKSKAFIFTKTALYSRLIETACKKINIEPITSDDIKNFINDVEDIKPDVLFIDESVISSVNEYFINELKQISGLETAFIIYTSTSTVLSKIAQKIGADAFLPIPFSKNKFESILRNVANLPKRILFVSKSQKNMEKLNNKLEKMGFEGYFSETGEDCMKKTHQIFPDLIICDYYLFDMNGSLLCKKIKESNLSTHIPVILTFKGNSAEIIEECFESGAQDVLLYPIEETLNIDRIIEIINPPKKGRKEIALVIDDSAIVRGLITRMLKNLGFITYAAENGLEGLKAARKIRPDIITCDYDMPIMDGWGFCMEAKQDENIDAPIIIVSARGNEVDKKKGKVLGVTEYLVKPFKEEDLKKSIAKALATRKKEKEREAMLKYVAKDVITNINEIIEGIKKKEPEEKVITVLFSDICSFTSKCERLSPRAVVKLLNEYFELMINILIKNNGIIDKLIGDAIVARFDCGEVKVNAINAVRSGLEMLEALENMNKNALEPIKIRIGINTGELILGNIGSESFRLDYTMIGDNVNIGQRLESQAPHMGCLISESTYSLIKNKIEVGDVKGLSLKGKEEIVNAYHVLKIIE